MPIVVGRYGLRLIERWFHDRNSIAVGVSWAAERLAVARLDASALAQGAAS